MSYIRGVSSESTCTIIYQNGKLYSATNDAISKYKPATTIIFCTWANANGVAVVSRQIDRQKCDRSSHQQNPFSIPTAAGAACPYGHHTARHTRHLYNIHTPESYTKSRWRTGDVPNTNSDTHKQSIARTRSHTRTLVHWKYMLICVRIFLQSRNTNSRLNTLM